MTDTVAPHEIPPGLMSHAIANIDQIAPHLLDADDDGFVVVEQVVCAVLHAAGHHLITDGTQAELARELDALLPGEPYEKRDALDQITWALLRAMGVNGL